MNRNAKTARRAPARVRHTDSKKDSGALRPDVILKSALITIGIGIALILVASLGAYFYSDPNALILPLGIAASALTALFGGILSARMQGHAALMSGLCNGVILIAAMILASLFFKSAAAGYSALVSAALHAGFLCLSVAGAYLGQKRTTPKKRRR